VPSDRSPAAPSTSISLIDAAAAATADAAVALSLGLADFAADGQIAPKIKMRGAEALARMAMLQLNHPGEIDLAAARAQAMCILDRRHGAYLQAHLPALTVDAAFRELIDHAIAMADRVAATERALAH